MYCQVENIEERCSVLFNYLTDLRGSTINIILDGRKNKNYKLLGSYDGENWYTLLSNLFDNNVINNLLVTKYIKVVGYEL